MNHTISPWLQPFARYSRIGIMLLALGAMEPLWAAPEAIAKADRPSLEALEIITPAQEKIKGDNAQERDKALKSLMDGISNPKTTPTDRAFMQAIVGQSLIENFSRKLEGAGLLQTALDTRLLSDGLTEQMGFYLAATYYDLGKSEEAISVLDRLIQDVPITRIDLYQYHAFLLYEKTGKLSPEVSKLAEIFKAAEASGDAARIAVANQDYEAGKAKIIATAERGLASIDKAMRMKPVLPEALYAIGASLNQVEYLWRYEKSAAYLECLVRDYPAKETYWRQLQAVYAAARNYLAALLTIERAQAQGLLNTPKDNEMRVSLLYNLERFADAAALMEKGLGDGSIPDTQRNWDTLAYCYTILKQEDKLIAALKRASELHDWSAVDLQLAQIYYRLQRFDETINSLETAIQKGSLKDPLSTYIFLAQVAMLRKDFPKAKAALDDAAALNSQDTAQITKLDSVRRYYDQMLENEQKNAEREAKKKQKK